MTQKVITTSPPTATNSGTITPASNDWEPATDRNAVPNCDGSMIQTLQCGQASNIGCLGQPSPQPLPSQHHIYHKPPTKMPGHPKAKVIFLSPLFDLVSGFWARAWLRVVKAMGDNPNQVRIQVGNPIVTYQEPVRITLS
ncbi:hypothetical protein CH063_07745, partial [Colletotrichum higginsianum]